MYAHTHTFTPTHTHTILLPLPLLHSPLQTIPGVSTAICLSHSSHTVTTLNICVTNWCPLCSCTTFVLEMDFAFWESLSRIWRGGEGRGGEEWKNGGISGETRFRCCMSYVRTYIHSQRTINGGLVQFFTLHLLRVSQDCLNTHHAQCRFTEGHYVCAASRCLLGGWVLWTVAALYSDLIREGLPR